jgi:AGCS family alanine or glycine:cation symporter
VLPAIELILREAFNPSAGVAGTGMGVFLVTMMWGIRRGLFSNEAGQGSAPIAHAAAKTDEPVSEGVVALLEPCIDTIVICAMTALVIVTTGVWDDTVTTRIPLRGGDLSYVTSTEEGAYLPLEAPPAEQIRFEGGRPVDVEPGAPQIAWHEAALGSLYVDNGMTEPFSGAIDPGRGTAVSTAGQTYTALWGPAVESGAPLTMLGFQHGLPGTWGNLVVLISVILFAVSTAISWSYYGDRCAFYLMGKRAVIPYRMTYVVLHFVGAVLPLASIWALGDVFLGIVILPNLLALILLSPEVKEMTRSYFEREPWRENYDVQKRLEEARRKGERRS